MTGRISLKFEDEDCDELVEMSFDSDYKAGLEAKDDAT
jgi:hypothetical protein